MATKKIKKQKGSWKKVPKGKELETIAAILKTSRKNKKNAAEQKIEEMFEQHVAIPVRETTPTRKLTTKEQKFCEEYLIDCNATQAAIRAGYSKRSARQIGTETMSKLVIKNVIKQKQRALLFSTQVTAERVAKELARIAFFDERELYDAEGKPKRINDLDDDTAAAVGLKMSDKVAALEKLGKHLGMFEETLNLKYKTPVQVNVASFTPEQAAQAYKDALKPNS